MATLRRRNIIAGAIGGIAVWLAYATVEFLLLSLTPLLLSPGTEWNVPFWQGMAMLLGVYVVSGALLGAVIGGLLGPAREDLPDRTMVAATLMLPVAFAANLLSGWPLSGGESISLAIAPVLAISLIVSLRSPDWHRRLAFLNGPLVVSVLLLSPAWIGSDLLAHRSGTFRLAVILGALLGTVLLSFLIRRIRVVAWTPHRYALGVLGMLIVACATGLAFNAGPAKLPARKIAAPAGRPNVILIVMDTVRADHTSLYGYERDTTPHLREMAKEATLYTRAIAVSDMTLPTHASMFTGLYPRTHGSYFAPPAQPYGRPLDEHFITLAELLQTNGYRTMGVVANSAYLAPDSGLAQGFEAWDYRWPVAVEYKVGFSLRHPARWLLSHFFPTDSMSHTKSSAAEVTDSALRMLDGADGPAFLFMNFMDSHPPYEIPARLAGMYPCSDRRLMSPDFVAPLTLDVASGKHRLTSQEKACLTAAYDEGIVNIDSALGQFFAALKQRGAYDNSLIIVTADHGEALGDHDQIGHGGLSLFQEQISVPSIVKYPDTRAREIVDTPVSQVDFFPTVMDVTGITSSTPTHGESLRAASQKPPRNLVSVSHPLLTWMRCAPKYDRVKTSIVSGNWKFITSTTGEQELYDLTADPGELHNLFAESASVSAALQASISQWMTIVPLGLTGGSRNATQDTIKRLKSLGYAQ